MVSRGLVCGRLRDPTRVSGYLLFDFFFCEQLCLADAFGLGSKIYLGGSLQLACRG
jgi:hypothetical protein